MGYSSRYEQGSWNVVCSMCGRDFKAFELRKHWQGQYRCDSCWEPRHPQDFVRAVQSERAPPWTQQDTEGPFVGVCTPNGQSAVPGQGYPDCMIPGYLHPFFDPNITT